MINKIFSIVIACLISVIFLPAQTVPKDAVEVPKAGVMEEMEKRKEREPKISPEKLAEFGNSLIAKRGFDVTFADVGGNAFGNAEVDSTDFELYKLKNSGGAETTFATNQHGSHPCGTWTSLTMTKLTENRMTIFARGKSYNILIPKGMSFDQIELVDKDLKTVIRRWNTTLDDTPEAISKDGKIIYIWTQFDKVFLGISDTGKFRFVSADDPNLIKTNIDLKDFPKDEGNDYLAYKRFGAGNQTFTVKFSNPCT